MTPLAEKFAGKDLIGNVVLGHEDGKACRGHGWTFGFGYGGVVIGHDLASEGDAKHVAQGCREHWLGEVTGRATGAQSLAIFGAGPIGSLALALAKLRGIPKVCVIDRIEQRLDVARQLKADCVINSAKEDAVAAIREFTKGGAEFVIDAVGVDATRRAGVNACARGGRLLFIGMAENDSGLPWIEMIRNEQSIFTTFCYAARDFQTALSLLESRKLDLTPWTETRSLDDGQAGFMKMTHNPGGTLKLIFKP